MNRPLRSVFVTAIAIAFAVCLGFFVSDLSAQEAVPPADTVAAAAPDGIPDFLSSALAKHSWIATALAIFGSLSVSYQAVIAWAHQRAAATTDDADDKWLASLEAKPWFRLLDRVFYWGGYLGAKLGGKKL